MLAGCHSVRKGRLANERGQDEDGKNGTGHQLEHLCSPKLRVQNRDSPGEYSRFSDGPAISVTWRSAPYTRTSIRGGLARWSADFQRYDAVILELEHVVEVYRTAREIAGDLPGHDDFPVALRDRERLDRVIVFFACLDPPSLDRGEAFDRLALVAHGCIGGEACVQCPRIVQVLRCEIDLDRFWKKNAHYPAPYSCVPTPPQYSVS